jgi:LAO/AO transport system kinase
MDIQKKIPDLIQQIKNRNLKTLARTISLIENEGNGYEELLLNLPFSKNKIIGITGPPGAGKSTLTDVLIEEFLEQNKSVGVVCIDPSSPFNNGALLGDRIRMNRWFNNKNVFIRSLASRGNVGGVNPKIIEITSLMQAAGFDYIIIETVGAGQNEVEIAGIADVTVVVLIPDSGDDIQTLKSGLMEIADIFVVNKSDRSNAAGFTKDLRSALSFYPNDIPVIQTIAVSKTGIDELAMSVEKMLQNISYDKRAVLLAQKAFYIIREMRMKNISKEQLRVEVIQNLNKDDFNFYAFVKKYMQ